MSENIPVEFIERRSILIIVSKHKAIKEERNVAQERGQKKASTQQYK